MTIILNYAINNEAIQGSDPIPLLTNNLIYKGYDAMAKSYITNAPEFCQVDGCSKKHHARGYCSKHYQRLWKKGLPPLNPKYDKGCQVPGCKADQYTRGYCNRHYRQIQTHGVTVGDTKITKFDLNEIITDNYVCKIVLRDCRSVRICSALIDVEDHQKVCGTKWHFSEGYVKNADGGRLHRLIMDLQPNSHLEVDHINHDTLDNRKLNLRVCTHKENTRNRKIGSSNTSGFKGIDFKKDTGKWTARIGVNGDREYLGSFVNILDAAKAYDKKAVELFGEFAATNKELGLL